MTTLQSILSMTKGLTIKKSNETINFRYKFINYSDYNFKFKTFHSTGDKYSITEDVYKNSTVGFKDMLLTIDGYVTCGWEIIEII